MTWSIVARDRETGLFGIAVTTRAFAVGAICPHASRHGAISTQALSNPTYGPRGLRLLEEGIPAPKVLDLLIDLDKGRDARQLHIIDASGVNAAWTGTDCIEWAGQIVDEHVSVAGNMLVGPKVIEETFDTYAKNDSLPFVERLLLALDAGQAAGGDKRGKQSAAILIHGDDCYPRLSMRVDDHPEPLEELRRLYGVAQERFMPYSLAFPREPLDSGIVDWDEIERLIENPPPAAAILARRV
jgi:uncharacterized Ntn-hydrolase superfamily protein